MLSGLAGTTAAGAFDLAGAAGVVGLYTTGSCAAGLKTFFAGPRALAFLSLGAGVPLGGTLTLSSCGLTANNTVLYVGTGCPVWALPFNCRVGNDDAADDPAAPGCVGNAGASTAVLRAVGSRVFHVQLGGFLGAPVVSGLWWRYDPPGSGASLSTSPVPSASPSRSRSASRSRTLSSSRSRTRSASQSATRTRKPKILS